MRKATILNKVFFFIVLFFTISLPLPIAFSSIAVILLVIFFLIDIKKTFTNIEIYRSNPSNIFLLIIFASLAFSVLYSDDKQNASKGILAALPLIVLPLSVARLTTLSIRQYKLVKILFVMACFAASMVYFVRAVSKSGLLDGSYLLYQTPLPISQFI
jgi:hypothetical protein